ncbi:hypothetical protein ABZX30_30885 [Streptomyces sp. NPDC004542]
MQSATVLKAPFSETERVAFDAFLTGLPHVNHRHHGTSTDKTPAGGR